VCSIRWSKFIWNSNNYPLFPLADLRSASATTPLKATKVRAGPAFFDYDEGEKCIPRGLFGGSTEWYAACLEQHRQLICNGELAASSRSDALLANRYLPSQLPHLAFTSDAKFYLKHVDSRDVNFLVDDDYNITGMIDWEMCIFAPKESAFQCPLFVVDRQ
jgi:hypothetical protein